MVTDENILSIHESTNSNSSFNFNSSISKIKQLERIDHLPWSSSNVNMQDIDGLTPLHHAICAKIGDSNDIQYRITKLRNKDNNIKFLIDKGADINIQDNQGRTALHYAYFYQELYIFKNAKEEDYNIKDTNGLIPHNYCTITSDYETFRHCPKENNDIKKPQILLSYSSKRGGSTAEKLMFTLKHHFGIQVETIDYYLPLDEKNILLSHGIVIPGNNAMVHPSMYGCDHVDPRYKYDLQRNEGEKKLVEIAFDHKIPLFGVCGGLQIINTYLNGTLHNSNNDTLKNQCMIIHDNGDDRKVWAKYMQNIDKPGYNNDCKEVRSDNGDVQVIKCPDPCFFATQFHPEMVHSIPEHTIDDVGYNRSIIAEYVNAVEIGCIGDSGFVEALSHL